MMKNPEDVLGRALFHDDMKTARKVVAENPGFLDQQRLTVDNHNIEPLKEALKAVLKDLVSQNPHTFDYQLNVISESGEIEVSFIVPAHWVFPRGGALTSAHKLESSKMKFTLVMKDPDAAFDAVQDAAKKSVALIEGLSEGERGVLTEQRTNEGLKYLEQWLDHGEYITVEFDPKTNIATVLKAK